MFCRLLIYNKDNGQLGACPDILRLYERYQVPNNGCISNNELLELRKISYMYMLGIYNKDGESSLWYNQSECFE